MMRRKITACLLSVSLIASMCSGCGGAAKAAATLIRLMRSEGSVSIADGDGKDVKPEENLGLYSGYQVATEKASFAWINLDDTKLTKMDEESQVEIQKDGNSLEVLVNSGSLYFNITEPLGEEESLNIRTSDMITGIRGTQGWVEVPDPEHMYVYILEGTVECTVTGKGTAGTGTAGTGAAGTGTTGTGAAGTGTAGTGTTDTGTAGMVTESVTAGERAELISTAEETAINKEYFSSEDIADFVRVELEASGQNTGGQNTGEQESQAAQGLSLEEAEQMLDEKNAPARALEEFAAQVAACCDSGNTDGVFDLIWGDSYQLLQVPEKGYSICMLDNGKGVGIYEGAFYNKYAVYYGDYRGESREGTGYWMDADRNHYLTYQAYGQWSGDAPNGQ